MSVFFAERSGCESLWAALEWPPKCLVWVSGMSRSDLLFKKPFGDAPSESAPGQEPSSLHHRVNSKIEKFKFVLIRPYWYQIVIAFVWFEGVCPREQRLHVGRAVFRAGTAFTRMPGRPVVPHLPTAAVGRGDCDGHSGGGSLRWQLLVQQEFRLLGRQVKDILKIFN